jgi:membrane DNA delivery protein
MTDNAITGLVAILTAIIGVAIIAVLVSNSSNTAKVIGAGGSAFGNILKVAVSPVTGGGGLGIANGMFGNVGTLGPNYGIPQ